MADPRVEERHAENLLAVIVKMRGDGREDEEIARRIAGNQAGGNQYCLVLFAVRYVLAICQYGFDEECAARAWCHYREEPRDQEDIAAAAPVVSAIIGRVSALGPSFLKTIHMAMIFFARLQPKG